MKTVKLLIIASILCSSRLPLSGAAEGEKSLEKSLEEVLPGLGAEDLNVRRDRQQRLQDICFQAGAPGNESRRAEACRLMAGKLSSDLSAPARVWLLKQLERIGRAECVEAVAAALDDRDPRVRDAARRALANNPCPRAGDILCEKLKGARDAGLEVAYIGALGFRGESAAVPLLSRELRRGNKNTAAAAAIALGRIATPEAARALAGAREGAGDELRLLISDSHLRCAEKMLEGGNTSGAAAIYRELYRPDEPARLAALVGLLKTGGDEAGAMLLKILASGDAGDRKVAMGQIRQIPAGAVKKLCRGLGDLPPSGQAALLSGLAVRGDRSALPAVLAAERSGEESVRIAALRALGSVGDASVVPLLVERMGAGGDAGSAARKSLESLAGEDADGRLIELMQRARDPGQRALLIEVLQERRAASAAPALLEEARHEDAGVRLRALAALGRLAGSGEVAGMIQVLQKAEGAERDEAERSITAICLRIPRRDGPAGPVLAAYARAGEDEKNTLLPLLGRIGGTAALEEIRRALKSDDVKRQDAGARGLCNWPDAGAAGDLLNLAGVEKHRSQALRALVRVVQQGGGPPDEQRAALLKQAMALATRKDDRNLILGSVSRIRRIESLRLAATCLDDPELSRRACRTIVELARNRRLRNRNREEFDRALEKVIQVSRDKNLADRAREYLSGR